MIDEPPDSVVLTEGRVTSTIHVDKAASAVRGRSTGDAFKVTWGPDRAEPADLVTALIHHLDFRRRHFPDSVPDSVIGKLRAARAELAATPPAPSGDAAES